MKTIKSCRKQRTRSRQEQASTFGDGYDMARQENEATRPFKEYNKKFDGCEREVLRISRSEIEGGLRKGDRRRERQT